MRTILFSLSFSLFFLNVAFSQFSEQKIITSCELCSPINAFSTDLDSDGDMDILTASNDDNKIAWYENDGTGQFSEQKIISN